MRWLVTGGAGYIGSHTVVELLGSGNDVVVLDNLCNSNAISIDRIEQIVGKKPIFVHGDVQDRALLDRVFAKHKIDGVIHFAGLKAVGQSVDEPLTYYQNNVHGTLVLCEAMSAADVFRLVFSSSATVYGEEAAVPYIETQARGTTNNPYGTSKAMVEQILTDLAKADGRWKIALLRYFNPIGAHPTGLIGEDPKGIPNNLLPFITQVAIGKRSVLSVFGDDYPTTDGSCVRDYLHVVDLARGHIKALNALQQGGISIFNLGTGKGVSVLEMVAAFEQITGQKVPYQISPRRPGDLPAFWADATKAKNELSWYAEFDLEKMLSDAWNWQLKNPSGYNPH
ncbi:UDP-glucose 4-epimerase GalE [Advenella sp. FME57]|uniref:UDP-glucose 4-epimerase GalE n=1 Tax=Advenella sp. FME57 TaxID=2742604 RepID=UPI001868F769|nr:UDP-glucose 4-epimerase GalE [Advenella sp. FME57]